MTIQFVDPKHVERYRDAINQDPEFQMAARLMSEDIRIRVSDVECIFIISKKKGMSKYGKHNN